MLHVMDSITNILVIGGGNIGTQVACKCASKGYNVTILSSKPEEYDGTLEIVDEYNKILTGKIKYITNSLKDAMESIKQDMIFITYPAFKLKGLAEDIFPYITSGVIMCVMPGTGGAEFVFDGCIKVGAVLCGLQRVPSVARIEKYGKRVRCEGLRDRLFIAAIPHNYVQKLALFMSELWGIPCETLPNYLSVTLTPSNPILHTARLKTMFINYEDGVQYSRNPLFYGEWTNEASQLLMDCDDELQGICRKLKSLQLDNVRSLKLHYQSNTVEEMTNKLRSIKSLHHLHSPLKKKGEYWIPDFEQRYFTADFPYGLAIIEQLGEIVDADIKNISETMNWYRKITNNKQCFDFLDYGIKNINDIYKIYKCDLNK